MSFNYGGIIVESIGDNLYSEICSVKNEIVLISPFIKHSVLEKLLDTVCSSRKVTCVTRWRPDEIAMGVSDLEIWPLLKARDNTVLKLVSNLHAKYYRVDNQCQIGSANLTTTALGWSQRPNQELMVQLLYNTSLKMYEENLISTAIDVTESLYQQMVQVVEDLKGSFKLEKFDTSRDITLSPKSSFNSAEWCPILRNPAHLYPVYSGFTEGLVQDSINMAYQELEYFRIPKGLSEDVFYKYLASLLMQEPIVVFVDECLVEPQRFGAMKKNIEQYLKERLLFVNSQTVWQNLMRWLLLFLPDKYGVKVPNYTEIFYSIK